MIEEIMVGIDLMEAHNIKINVKTGKIGVSESVELMTKVLHLSEADC
ncbi:hypothetical protein KEJ25_10570 [Candidatus Bathyarchaeota archaeon]|nr:hypothetical protein [Candidatus Bathyarchaeota archaeon]